MTINDIITKYYDEFVKRAKQHNNNSVILEPQEILHNILITAIKKYGNDDIDEDEGLRYILRSMFMESKFIPKREHHNQIPLSGEIDVIDESTIEE